MALRPKRVAVAIIGTAGRKEDASKMSAAVFERMVVHAETFLHNTCGLPNERVVLVSGGSAWADHVAVKLFLRQAMDPDGQPYAGLHLHLPCPIVEMPAATSLRPTAAASAAAAAATPLPSKRYTFEDNGSWSWTANPGRMLNTLHAAFSRSICISTIDELHIARSFGAKFFTDAHGFHARNKQVAASCQKLLAFTWGTSRQEPKDGGTKHTWTAASHAHRTHVPLDSLMGKLAPLPRSLCQGIAADTSLIASQSSTDSADSLTESTVSYSKPIAQSHPFHPSSHPPRSTGSKRRAESHLEEPAAQQPKSEKTVTSSPKFLGLEC